MTPRHRRTSTFRPHSPFCQFADRQLSLFIHKQTDKWQICGEPAISQHSHHVSLVQWTIRLLPVMKDLGSKPQGVLMWNRDSPVSVVSLHWWPRRDRSLWLHLRRALSQPFTRPSCRQCDNPTWSHTALLSRFHARCSSYFRLHNWHSWLLGGALWSVCFPSWETRAQNPRGYLCETGILLLALFRYKSPFAWSAIVNRLRKIAWASVFRLK